MEVKDDNKFKLTTKAFKPKTVKWIFFFVTYYPSIDSTSPSLSYTPLSVPQSSDSLDSRSPMFNFGLSSVLGNSTKNPRGSIKGDNWYIPYNGPYEAPPSNSVSNRRKQRDSWGDPIPFAANTDNIESGGDEDLHDKGQLRRKHESPGLTYGVQGVFDGDWNGVQAPGVSRFGVAPDMERGRRGSYGIPSTSGNSDPARNTFSPKSNPWSMVASGNSPTLQDYIPLNGVSGGVGESPVPQIRSQKDANRISLGSIFTFGARMRMGSPSRSLDEDRVERVDTTDRPTRPTSNPEKGRPHKTTTTKHDRPSTSKRQGEKSSQLGNYVLTNGKGDYHEYYDTLYSSLLVDDDNGPSHPYLARFKNVDERPHNPSPISRDLQVDKLEQLIQSHPFPTSRTPSHQRLPVASVGHPYAPYAHSGPDHGRLLRSSKLPDPPSDEAVLIGHQRQPYTQGHLSYIHHPYGQSSVSTGTTYASQTAVLQKPESGQIENLGPHQEAQVSPESKIGIMNAGVGRLDWEVGLDTKKPKTSRSTPNLRQSQIIDDANLLSGPSNITGQTAPPLPTTSLPHSGSKDWWLSAETWCDALLFPRPRLKVKRDKHTLYSQADESFIGGRLPSTSGRIVSPPPSPLLGEWDIEIHGDDMHLESRLRDHHERSGEGKSVLKIREPGIPSRVLAHSRSFDLHSKLGKEKAGYVSGVDSSAVRRGKAKADHVARDVSNKKDGLPPPVPVQDLAEVLMEGQQLEEDRQAWQALAVNSIGNKRSRTLSRSRTKSLTRRGRSSVKRKEGTTSSDKSEPDEEFRSQSGLEYLAAQACLGHQAANVSGILSSLEPDYHGNPRKGSTEGGNTLRSGHAHSNSLSTTSRPKSATPKSHSRNNSLGYTAAHAGRIAVGKLCGGNIDPDLNRVEKSNPVGNANTIPQGPFVRSVPDLEGALKREGTKVIRLADPAYIPVDKGLPVSESESPRDPVPQGLRRTTPSPDLSVSNMTDISHSKVGIAIGTPPEEAAGGAPAIISTVPVPVSASYVPSHPYAQGGFSFGIPKSPPNNQTTTNSRDLLPDPPTFASGVKRVIPHPYASTSADKPQDRKIQPPSHIAIPLSRDSYLDANGLTGQFRSGDLIPDTSKMWAQVSPNTVREVLPNDLQYSPYAYDLKVVDKPEGRSRVIGPHDQRVKTIHDTSGVAEALLGLAGYERDAGLVAMDEHRDEETGDIENAQLDVPNYGLRKVSQLSIPRTIASSHIVSEIGSLPSQFESSNQRETASPIRSPNNPVPVFRPLGSPNDLDSFQDLFYQPSSTDVPHDSPSPVMRPDSVSWDHTVRNRHTGSSLTSLARQLGVEYEALASSNPSSPSGVYLHSRRSFTSPPVTSGLTGEGNLQFVLEEMASTDSLVNIGDDDYSLQTSSIKNESGEEDDPTGLLRLGTIETLSTPPAVDAERRTSYNGETVYDYDQDCSAIQPESPSLSQALDDTIVTLRPRHAVNGLGVLGSPSLDRPLTQVTRSSFMTTSDVSGMSGLSDFPVPPKSIYSEHFESNLSPFSAQSISAYFDDERHDGGSLLQQPGTDDSRIVSTHAHVSADGQVEFGVNQSAFELANSLSSPEGSR